MTFISFEFYIFLAVVLQLYYLVPLRFRWIVLLTGSLYFYLSVSEFPIRGLLILIVQATLCWGVTGSVIRADKQNKLLFIIDVIVTALPLILVRELVFAGEAMGFEEPAWFIVPVGIAFYTMQLIAYAADVYQKKIIAEKNYFKFLLFVSFFPHIIQGPIPRYDQLSGQLYGGNRFDERKFVKGFMLIIWGFFLKLCIADKAGIIVNCIFDGFPTYPGLYVLIAGVLYSFQLYADFLAVTSLAQGIAGLFGIDLVDNFRHPYLSVSVREFWRRWHMSLSSWLRDYIYIPLGGSRKGRGRRYMNLIITFAVSGLWHGAGYKFMVWGLLHGAYLILEDLTDPGRRWLTDRLKLDRHPSMQRLWRQAVTFILVCAAWIIFRAADLKTGLSMIRSMFTVHNPWILTNDAILSLGLGWKEFLALLFSLIVLLIVSLKQEAGLEIRDRILEFCLPVRWSIYIAGILLVMVFGTYGYGFDPQAFIYGGF